MTTTTETPMEPTRTPRRLTRSASDRKLAGVAGGLGEYFGVDAVLFRLGFVLLVFAGGSGLLAYLIAWLVLPEGGAQRVEEPPHEPARNLSGPVIVGGLLVLFGFLTLLDSSRWWDIDAPGILFPVLFLGGGAWLLYREGVIGRAGDGDTATTSGAPAPDADEDQTGSSLVATTDTDELSAEPWTAPPAEGDDGFPPPPPGDEGTAEIPAPVPSAPENRRPSAARLTFGALFIGWGVVGLGELLDWWNADAAAVLAVSLIVTGAGLVASAWLGRGWPLIPLAVVLGLALLVVSVVDVPIRGGIGERSHSPETLIDVRDEYRLGIGQLEIDLTELADTLEPNDRVTIDAELGIGELRVIVPEGLGVDVDAEAGIGETLVELPDLDLDVRRDGIGEDLQVRRAPETLPLVTIDAQVGIGQVSVVDR